MALQTRSPGLTKIKPIATPRPSDASLVGQTAGCYRLTDFPGCNVRLSACIDLDASVAGSRGVFDFAGKHPMALAMRNSADFDPGDSGRVCRVVDCARSWPLCREQFSPQRPAHSRGRPRVWRR
jgi:hypothetical protein